MDLGSCVGDAASGESKEDIRSASHFPSYRSLPFDLEVGVAAAAEREDTMEESHHW